MRVDFESASDGHSERERGERARRAPKRSAGHRRAERGATRTRRTQSSIMAICVIACVLRVGGWESTTIDSSMANQGVPGDDVDSDRRCCMVHDRRILYMVFEKLRLALRLSR